MHYYHIILFLFITKCICASTSSASLHTEDLSEITDDDVFPVYFIVEPEYRDAIFYDSTGTILFRESLHYNQKMIYRHFASEEEFEKVKEIALRSPNKLTWASSKTFIKTRTDSVLAKLKAQLYVFVDMFPQQPFTQYLGIRLKVKLIWNPLLTRSKSHHSSVCVVDGEGWDRAIKFTPSKKDLAHGKLIFYIDDGMHPDDITSITFYTPPKLTAFEVRPQDLSSANEHYPHVDHVIRLEELQLPPSYEDSSRQSSESLPSINLQNNNNFYSNSHNSLDSITPF